jgi:hypothetical protein
LFAHHGFERGADRRLRRYGLRRCAHDGAGAAAEWNLETSSGTGLKNLRSRL